MRILKQAASKVWKTATSGRGRRMVSGPQSSGIAQELQTFQQTQYLIKLQEFEKETNDQWENAIRREWWYLWNLVNYLGAFLALGLFLFVGTPWNPNLWPLLATGFMLLTYLIMGICAGVNSDKDQKRAIKIRLEKPGLWLTPLQPLALAIYWFSKRRFRADRLARREKEGRPLSYMPVVRNQEERSLLAQGGQTILLHQQYMSAKYEEATDTIDQQLKKTKDTLRKLDGLSAKFKDHQFTKSLVQALEQQVSTLTTARDQYSEKRQSLDDEYTRLKTDVQEVQSFRDIVTAAELVEKNKQVLGLVMQEMEKIEARSLELLNPTLSLDQEVQALVRSVPELGDIYRPVSDVDNQILSEVRG